METNKNNKNKILTYLFGFIIILLLIFGVSQYLRANEAEKVVKDYKTELIASDSLRKTVDGRYQKLVNDMNSEKDIKNYLKEQNETLFELLKAEKKKPISYTIIQAKPESKVDTITIKDTIRDGLSFKTFKDYYPSQINPFITYSGEIFDQEIIGKFDLDSLSIGIVVSEKTKGLFEVDLDAPEWLNVTSLEVKSLPLEHIRLDKFDWLLGGSAGYNFFENYPVLEFEAGFRYKKTIFSVQGNTNREVKAGLKKLF